jgi:alpha-aminoadipic semialdehyde synthase
MIIASHSTEMMRRSKPICGSLVGNGIIGIRREDKNVWERRVPLVPKHVETLLKNGIVKKVLVQPSTIRAFDNRAYQEAGAEIKEDISEASTICAVKEVPAQLLIPERTYLFFSHTIKAQAYNMPLLDTILQKKIRLIDYERIVNEDGRMVKFGPHAGLAGTIDTLHALGLALLTRGYATPFLHLSMSKEYSSLEVALTDLREVGDQIRKRGLPREVCPLTIAITGAGSVSSAAQQILHHLPCKYIEVDDLPKLWKQHTKDQYNIHVVVVRAKDMVMPKDPLKRFSTREYYSNPNEFVPVFHEKIAPYLKVLINGMYWEPRFPRLLSIAQAFELNQQGRLPLLCLGDITCDVGGSVEFFVKATTIQNPFYVYNVGKDLVHEMHQFDGEGVIILGVDHIPAEFPKEASTDFGNGLMPLIEKVSVSDGTASLQQQRESLGPELFNAIITHQCELTPNFKYIAEMRKQKEQHDSKKRGVLVFGAGMTSGPCVQYLLKNQKNVVTLVDSSTTNLNHIMNTFGKALGLEDQAAGLRNVRADASNVDEYIVSLIKASDVVVSLLPATFHDRIAKVSIEAGVPLVTGSYISPAMEMLREKALAKPALVVNEMGLDPGIDIMTSAKLLTQIRKEGGIVQKYVSLCGALPQPENSDGPMGYKFSWSPRAVLTAATRPTRFLAQGKWFSVPGADLYHLAQPLSGFSGLDLHWVPNGDSEKYAKSYDLGGSDTVIRGTLRYSTFAPVVVAFECLGMLNDSVAIDELTLSSKKFISWPDLIKQLLGVAHTGEVVNSLAASLTKRIAERRAAVHSSEAFAALKSFSVSRSPQASSSTTITDEVSMIIYNFERLGLLDQTNIAPKTKSGFCVDTLCESLLSRMSYRSHEKDYVLMIHHITAFFPETRKTRTYRATLSIRGSDLNNSATALTVGLPVGATAQLILDGGLTGKKGLVIPTDPDIYEPVLKILDSIGIKMIEEVTESTA